MARTHRREQIGAVNEPVMEPARLETQHAHACPNCGTTLAGRYCHECGQKRIEPRERRFSWFVAQFVRAVTMVDGRFLRSIGRLLFRPGSLDRDWMEGRRRTSLAPLNLFLLANLIYFFHPPLTDLNLSLGEQFQQMAYGPLASSLVEARLAERGTTLERYAAAYREQAASLAKVMVILHVPLLAAVLAALHFRRRVFYVDHIAVALNFWAFLLLHAMLTPRLLTFVQQVAGPLPGAVLPVVVLGVMLLYAWQQVRVAYRQPGWLAAAKLPLFFVGLFLSHLVYRFVQFLAVFATT